MEFWVCFDEFGELLGGKADEYAVFHSLVELSFDGLKL